MTRNGIIIFFRGFSGQTRTGSGFVRHIRLAIHNSDKLRVFTNGNQFWRVGTGGVGNRNIVAVLIGRHHKGAVTADANATRPLGCNIQWRHHFQRIQINHTHSTAALVADVGKAFIPRRRRR